MTDVIVSQQNRRVKDAIKLRDRRGRDKQRRTIIDGVREIRRAAAADLHWSEVFVCDELLCDEAAEAVAELQAAGAEIVRVAPQVFAKLAFGERSEGLVAVAHTPERTLDGLALPAEPVVAVLEALEKPGNVGAILRSADAAGISAVLLASPQSDLFNPNTIRASQGAVFTLSVATATTDEVLAWLRARRFHILTACVNAEIDYTATDFSPPCAIVLGSEAAGLSDTWQGENVAAVRLPMLGAVDSLNVSVTAGVLFYEALRQRDQAGKRRT